MKKSTKRILSYNKLKIICFSFLIFASGCKEKESKAVFVEVYYVSPCHLYPMNIGCSRYLKSGSSSDEMFFYMKIYDRYLEEFNNCYNELKSVEASNYNFDTRIQMLVHQQNSTDTVCMNKNSRIVINGIEQKNGDKLFKLMNSLIEKDLKSKNHK